MGCPAVMEGKVTNDAKRLIGLQVDKLLAFIGFDGMNDEMYDQFRGAGYINGAPGASVTDLTPKFPPELMPFIEFLVRMVDRLAGFDKILHVFPNEKEALQHGG